MSTAPLSVRRAVAPAVAGCLAVLVLAAAPPASASRLRSEEAPAGSPYAAPLPTLGGLTLAQYLARHQAGDRRLR